MKRVAGMVGPLAGVVFIALAFGLGWRFATALVGGAFVMLGVTVSAWAIYRFNKDKSE